MKNPGRAAIVMAVVGSSMAFGVGPAAADPPTPVEGVPPVTIEACGTDVTITEIVNKQREHRKKGEETIKSTGRLVIEVSTPDGRSALLNASGSARITPTETGFVADARGRNLLYAIGEQEREIFAALGIPTLAITSGPFTVDVSLDPVSGLFSDVDLLRRPPVIEDVCDLLE